MNTAKVQNLSHKTNLPYPQRMQIAKQSFIEPQKLNYKKSTELTPYELALSQQYEDGRNDWATYDDKLDFIDKAGNVEDWD